MTPIYVELATPNKSRKFAGVAALSLLGVAALVGLVAGAPTPVVCAVLSIPFLAIIIRQPTLRRLALRNAIRRPAESALVRTISSTGPSWV